MNEYQNIAVKILNSIGILDRPRPGSTDSQELERIQNLERVKAQTVLRKAEYRAEMEAYEPI